MDNLWVIDLEASGLDPASYPIEVGIVGREKEYQALIIPEKGWQFWSNESEVVHGIPRQELYDNGRPTVEVANELNALLAGATVYSDCRQWDGFWQQVLFGTVGIHQQFKLEDITDLLEGKRAKVYIAAYDDIRQSGEHRTHRALDDARVIYQAMNCATQ